jgi:nucleotide-binding universal stress UspA family protein
MTFVVPFDGSDLAETALVRAVEFSRVFEEEDVLAVSVVPNNNTGYARDRGWLDSDETFDRTAVVSTLHEQVTDLCPSADFRHILVARYASRGAISNQIRKEAKKEDASMVFIGSENAGKIVTSISSIGGNIATEDAYDVVIVRQHQPAKVNALKDNSPHRKSKSDFYIPQ